MAMMNVPNRLKVLRAEHRLSQMDTAGRVAMSYNRYWRIENGYTDPTEAERLALAAVFGVAVGRVFPRRKAA